MALTRAVVPLMRTQGGGVVFDVVSSPGTAGTT
jgi:hypothetical protein